MCGTICVRAGARNGRKGEERGIDVLQRKTQRTRGGRGEGGAWCMLLQLRPYNVVTAHKSRGLQTDWLQNHVV